MAHSDTTRGILGPNRHPGGIVYLDLDILQPSDCRLRSATVEVILEEDRRPTADAEAARSKCPVKFTDNYGPKSLSGPERVERTRRIKNFTPMVNVLGSGAGGLGIDTERMTHNSSRWKFAGHITSSEGCIWYNKLRWNLDENASEAQSLHNNVIHTAFALEHNAERFYIKVNISGKLSNLSDRFKNKLKFGSVAKEQGIVTTMIEWRNGYHSPKVLDKIAESLPIEMQRENLANVSMEVPDALSASFGPVAASTSAVNNPTEPPLRLVQELDQGGPVGLLNGAQQPLRITEAEPTIESMEAAAGLLEAPTAESGRRPSYPRSESRLSEAVTLVENGEGSRNGGTVSFTPKLEQVEDDGAGAEPLPVNTKKATPRRRHLFGLLVLFSWFGNIRFLCAAAICHILGFSLPERRGVIVKAVEKQEVQERLQVDGPNNGKDLSVEEDSAGETIASVSPTIPRREFIRGRPRDRVPEFDAGGEIVVGVTS